MLTPVSKGNVLNLSAANGTIFTAPYKCLVIYSSNVYQGNTGSINKHRNGGFICRLFFGEFISSLIIMDTGETLVASGMAVPYKIISMRFLQ